MHVVRQVRTPLWTKCPCCSSDCCCFLVVIFIFICTAGFEFSRNEVPHAAELPHQLDVRGSA